MAPKRLFSMLAGLLILASLAACAPLPPATQAPGSQAPAGTAAAAQQAVVVATSQPAPTSTPEPSPTPAIPDPKSDPVGALLYASTGKLFKTAEFDYTMTWNMAPADEASRSALGEQADELESAAMEAKGSGAMEVTDPAMLKSKMRMDMAIDAYGQQMQMQMIVIDQTAWLKLTGQDEWQKVEGEQARSLAPGMSPEQMLQDFKSALDVQWIEDVTVGGEELSHLRFAMDPSKLDLAALTAGTTATMNMAPEELQAMFEDMQPVVDVWLAKPNLELRGEKMQLDWVMPLPEATGLKDVKLRVGMTMDMRFSNVNEPVTIEPPTE